MKRYPKITRLIKGALKRDGYSDAAFAEAIGMPYQTLQTRWRNPGSWRFHEWGSVLRHIVFFEEELSEIRKGLISRKEGGI